jgi:hypothetical protein
MSLPQPPPTTAPSIPPALTPTLQALLQARYGPEQREECAGWRGVFEEREGEGGVLVATRDVEACEVGDMHWSGGCMQACQHPCMHAMCMYYLGTAMPRTRAHSSKHHQSPCVPPTPSTSDDLPDRPPMVHDTPRGPAAAGGPPVHPP